MFPVNGLVSVAGSGPDLGGLVSTMVASVMLPVTWSRAHGIEGRAETCDCSYFEVFIGRDAILWTWGDDDAMIWPPEVHFVACVNSEVRGWVRIGEGEHFADYE